MLLKMISKYWSYIDTIYWIYGGTMGQPQFKIMYFDVIFIDFFKKWRKNKKEVIDFKSNIFRVYKALWTKKETGWRYPFLKRSLWRKKFFTFSIGQDKYTKLILETTFLYLFFQFEDIKSIFTNKKLIQIC